MTRTEYDKFVDELVTREREQLAESLNAVFAREGHSVEVLCHMVAKAVETQPAVTAHIVTEILDRLGILPAAPGAPDECP